MTYKLNKFFIVQNVDDPSAQSISTSYVEITGSKCEVKNISENPTILYKASFHMRDAGMSGDNPFVHLKLQKSNDNFSSNIVDISGCQINISGDSTETTDIYHRAAHPMFIVENFDSNYLRLVIRSYSADTSVSLHVSTHYDGSAQNVYYNPSLIVMEL